MIILDYSCGPYLEIISTSFVEAKKILSASNELIYETDGLKSDKKQIEDVLVTFLGAPAKLRKNGELDRFFGKFSFLRSSS
jgi:hypothetical protein